MNRYHDAFARAARATDLFNPFTLYKKCEGVEELGYPPEGQTKTANFRTVTVYDWQLEGFGAIIWRDVDKNVRTLNGEVGDGFISLFTAYPEDPPDLLQDQSGQFYVVKDALGVDALGAAVKLRVRRWKSDLPTIRNAAP
jgi:hypothetical protein